MDKASIKTLIRDGDYTVPNEDVAEALLIDHLFFALLLLAAEKPAD